MVEGLPISWWQDWRRGKLVASSTTCNRIFSHTKHKLCASVCVRVLQEFKHIVLVAANINIDKT